MSNGDSVVSLLMLFLAKMCTAYSAKFLLNTVYIYIYTYYIYMWVLLVYFFIPIILQCHGIIKPIMLYHSFIRFYYTYGTVFY